MCLLNVLAAGRHLLQRLVEISVDIARISFCFKLTEIVIDSAAEIELGARAIYQTVVVLLNAILLFHFLKLGRHHIQSSPRSLPPRRIFGLHLHPALCHFCEREGEDRAVIHQRFALVVTLPLALSAAADSSSFRLPVGF